MTKDAQEDVKVEDDVVDETEVAEMMTDAPESEPEVSPPTLEIPFKKIVIGVTDGGLMRILHNDIPVLALRELLRRLSDQIDSTIQQQAEAFERSQEKRT